MTSSVSSVIHPAPDGYGFTEEDWNDHDIKEVEEKGSQASPVTMYNASKVLAERAAWKFVEENKGKIGFDLVTILPSFVLGVSIIASGLSYKVPSSTSIAHYSSSQRRILPQHFYLALQEIYHR